MTHKEAEDKASKVGRGDQVAAIAQPVARAIDRIFKTNLQNCEGCKEMQRDLNNGKSFPSALKKRFMRKGNARRLQ